MTVSRCDNWTWCEIFSYEWPWDFISREGIHIFCLQILLLYLFGLNFHISFLPITLLIILTFVESSPSLQELLFASSWIRWHLIKINVDFNRIGNLYFICYIQLSRDVTYNRVETFFLKSLTRIFSLQSFVMITGEHPDVLLNSIIDNSTPTWQSLLW